MVLGASDDDADSHAASKRWLTSNLLTLTLQPQAGAVVLGVSGDDEDSHAAFKSKLGLPYTLLADDGNKVGRGRCCHLQCCVLVGPNNTNAPWMSIPMLLGVGLLAC